MTATLEIEYRRLGRSQMELPRVALGCGNFGGVGSAPEYFGRGLSEDQALALMDAAWALGITHFDTADAYGGGRSEQTIGKWIASRGLAPARVERQLRSSLERLGVERVDLYLAHDFDPAVPLADTLGVFDDLLAKGKIGAYGVSNFDSDQLAAALDAGSPRAIQNAHSLLERGDEERLLPMCAERDVAYLAFGPLAGGWLTGKYRRGEPFPAGSRMTQRPEPYERLVSTGTFDVLERLAGKARKRGMTMAGLSLAWLLADERVGQIVVGPGRPEHLEPVREALSAPLSRAERDELGAAL